VVLVSTVLERLGYSPDDRVVIVSCDDVGLNHSTNEAVFASLRDSAATSAAVMVPCPWARDAALRAEPGDDLGVHLTLNAEAISSPEFKAARATSWQICGRMTKPIWI